MITDSRSISRLAVWSLAVLFAGSANEAHASRPADHLAGRSGLELATGTKARTGRSTKFAPKLPHSSTPGLVALKTQVGPTWIAWDEDTKVPSRIIVEGMPVAGSIASPAAAAAFARAFLARHIRLLAPGSAPSDFTLVANDLDVDAGIRSVGFIQHHRGMQVLGGQISFRFKNDHLIAIGSEALPEVQTATRTTTLATRRAHERAAQWIDDDIPGTRGVAGPVEGPFVLPIIEGGRIEYREVMRVVVPVTHPPSRWSVYVDAQTGDRVAREQTMLFATAQVLYNTPVRYPGSARADYPASMATVVDGGATLQTNDAGEVTFATSPSLLEVFASGPLVNVQTRQGEAVSQTFNALDGAVARWDARNTEFADAQLTAFIHTGLVKDYVRNIAPSLGWLNQQIQVFANTDDSCNAASDGDSIFLFASTDDCENTGRIADVVYHEVGHSVHSQALIPGVGFFNVAVSEGISDYLSATITEDTGLARGFFYDNAPLRDFDPPNFEYRWPEDRGGVHDEGRIIGGALWDLRKLLVAKLGAGAGVAQADRIWYQSIRRAVDMPSMYTEALVADDDDGNLANGTPNGCEINEAFGSHGLFSLTEGVAEVTAAQTSAGVNVSLSLTLPSFPECPVQAFPVLRWRTGSEPTSVSDENPMALANGVYQSTIPLPEPGTHIEYQVDMNYSTGATVTMPDNIVDPWYEYYVGEVIELYCTGFADATDWSLANGFDIGVPNSNQSSVDPDGSFDNDGFALHNPGAYGPQATPSATSPVIDTQGYSDIRLQYRRWLTVEDGYWDAASITVDDSVVWRNFASDNERGATFHHVDKEWRFQDIDISEFGADGQVQIEFRLNTDGGLHFGGWTVDELCVVAAEAGPRCGNAVVDPDEECDDGNRTSGDGCSNECTLEPASDDGFDPGGATESSGGGLTESGSESGSDAQDTGLVGRGCACAASRRSAPGSGGLLLLGLALLGRRRRWPPQAPSNK